MSSKLSAHIGYGASEWERHFSWLLGVVIATRRHEQMLQRGAVPPLSC